MSTPPAGTAPAVTLEPLAAEHFGIVAGWLSRPETNRWLTSQWRGRQVTASLVAVMARSPRHCLFLFRCDGRAAGLVGICDIDEADATGTVFCVLGDGSAAGHGVSTRALGRVVRHGFAALGLSSLHGWMVDGNEASRRMLDKIGFRPAGRLRAATKLDGRPVDRVYYDITPSDLGAEP